MVILVFLTSTLTPNYPGKKNLGTLAISGLWGVTGDCHLSQSWLRGRSISVRIGLKAIKGDQPRYKPNMYEVAIPPAAVRVKIIYPAAGWISSYWPGKENKYDHDVNWHTVASEI